MMAASFRVMPRVKYWEIIADNLSKAGWSWGCVSAIDSNGRTIWIADAHRDDGKRFVVRADEKLTAFLELEVAIRAVAYHLFSASPFNTSQPTTSKLVPPPPQPIKSWPPSAMAYSVSSSPCCECFRTVARTARSLCMLSTYTSAKPEFPFATATRHFANPRTIGEVT